MDIKPILIKLLGAKGIAVSEQQEKLLERFSKNEENIAAVKSIIANQEILMEKWKIQAQISDVLSRQIMIPNAKCGQPYETILDYDKLNLNGLTFLELEGLTQLGLAFNKDTKAITGIPEQSGDFKIKMLFKVAGESEDTHPNERNISFIINPDPKSLWKDLPSDTSDLFWKEDDVAVLDSLGEKHIVVASKRGRSHKNVGSFRDDDFAYKHFGNTGWSVVAVSDGAGSYSLSRKGSALACEAIVSYFEHHSQSVTAKIFEQNLLEYGESKSESLLASIEIQSKKYLYEAVKFAHGKIKEHADITATEHPELFGNPKAKTALDYYHATLIFALYKKFDFGYVLLTFGVGDCPVAVMNKEQTETTLMNWLDVGEFGGGTRFVTQPEIFHSEEHPMSSRFNFKIIPDFSYLFLMSDGIYDPKFMVEANLEKHEKWATFLTDLQGENEDHAAVDFSNDNKDIAAQLSTWMDFWSPGNHDDRTLAIVF